MRLGKKKLALRGGAEGWECASQAEGDHTVGADYSQGLFTVRTMIDMRVVVARETGEQYVAVASVSDLLADAMRAAQQQERPFDPERFELKLRRAVDDCVRNR